MIPRILTAMLHYQPNHFYFISSIHGKSYLTDIPCKSQEPAVSNIYEALFYLNKIPSVCSSQSKSAVQPNLIGKGMTRQLGTPLTVGVAAAAAAASGVTSIHEAAASRSSSI